MVFYKECYRVVTDFCDNVDNYFENIKIITTTQIFLKAFF